VGLGAGDRFHPTRLDYRFGAVVISQPPAAARSLCHAGNRQLGHPADDLAIPGMAAQAW
jgi:hypothetical protein